ncbi:MAG TPA: phosphate acyltransferase PlsX [Dehalococcoidales bacterium]|nr:phosphate acyltransferase PlsX [Dehalococcoidales bacterium]
MGESSNSSQRVRVAVDAMGGDFAPGEIVSGAIQAARDLGVEIILVGPGAEIEKETSKADITKLPVRLVEASELIEDGEQPAIAVMRKPNSSMAVATRLVKEGEADAIVSAGSTGALMVCALQYLGTLPGIERPVAGGPFLGLAPRTVLLDLGANVGCQPYQLVNFAVAGCVYARSFLNIDNPTVGLLNVGAEEGKGNDLAKEAYPLLKKSGLNFIGNVEGMDIAFGKANVIVCDGFIGNIVIKLCEGLGRTVKHWLAEELKANLSAADLESTTNKLYRLMSPAVVMGGGPLLGVDGVAAVAHGASHAPQIAGTIKHAKLAVETKFVDTLRSELEKAQKTISAQ